MNIEQGITRRIGAATEAKQDEIIAAIENGSFVDTNNTTTTPLLAGATFTGTATEILHHSAITLVVYSDVGSATNGLVIDFSVDGLTWYEGEAYTVPAGKEKFFTPPTQLAYYRIRYTNGGSDQTVFRLNPVIKKRVLKWSSHNINATLNDDDDGELNVVVPKLRTAQDTYISQAATASGNSKVSLEEFENSVSVNSNTQLKTTQFDSAGNEIDSIDNEPLIADALNIISSEYSATVSVRNKAKNLLKFGRNPSVGTSLATIWYTGQDQANETYVADNVNSIDSISSASASDTEIVTIEGHTMTGGNRTFSTQNITLNGQNRVALTTALNRVTRVYHAGQSPTDLVGEVYVYENTAISAGKPTDTTKIHLTVAAGDNQSEKCATSLSSTDYWIITGFRGSVLNKVASYADVRLEWRKVGGVFRQIEDITTSSYGAGIFDFKPYIVIPPNSDVRLRAISDSTREVSGSIQGFLAS